MAVDVGTTRRLFTHEEYRRMAEVGADGYRDVSRVSGVATVTLQAFPDVAPTITEIFA